MVNNPLLRAAELPAAAPLAIGQHEAARLTGLSAKTLGRLADAGEAVGRVKLDRRVLYHLPTLAAWLAARAGAPANPTT